MKSEKKRTYNSSMRKSKAVQTKSCILEAAKVLFQKEGFDRVTIGMLAKAANVSMPTIYAIFKSKQGVLQSLIDESLPPHQFESLVKKAMEEKSPKKHLSLSAKIARQIYDAERELMDILRGAAALSPEFKELEQERERRRYERQSESVKLIMKEKPRAKGLALQKARDILWALTGRDMYRLLVIDRRWTSDEYEKWLASALIKSLLDF